MIIHLNHLFSRSRLFLLILFSDIFSRFSFKMYSESLFVVFRLAHEITSIEGEEKSLEKWAISIFLQQPHLDSLDKLNFLSQFG